MSQDQDIATTPPKELGDATAMAHAAAQFLTKAGRANLTAAPDDSHSNLGWDSGSQRFLSHPLPGANGDVFITLSLDPFELALVDSATGTTNYSLAGHSLAETTTWLDDALGSVALTPCGNVELPYALPPEVAAVAEFSDTIGLATLAAWFGLANKSLERLAADQSGLTPGPSPVRCWPHHFDIATYVSLESGDAETTEGIGVGMSPGDGSYTQPYFYVNPWPHLDANTLPDAPVPGHWHTDGFVGAIATADELLSADDTEKSLSGFLEKAFVVGYTKLMG